MRSLLLFCALAFPAIAASASGEVAIQGDLAPLNIAPTFEHGYLAVYEEADLAVYAPDGSLAMRIAQPDGGRFGCTDMDPDGSVVATVTGWGHYPKTGSIALFKPDGSPAGQIVTSPYLPSQVSFAPDHSLWTLGTEDPRATGEPPADYFLLRHYSRAGELLGQFLPRSSFPADSEPVHLGEGFHMLRVANGRVGAVLNGAGERRSRNLWLEVDLNGAEIGRWDAIRVAAITDSGVVYTQIGKQVSTLDHASGSWKPVQLSDDFLLGAEGNTLVFLERGTNLIRRAAQP
jgi:hypothetical protein